MGLPSARPARARRTQPVPGTGGAGRRRHRTKTVASDIATGAVARLGECMVTRDTQPARDVKTTAEHLLYLLAAHGIEYLFLNPGTDSAPLQEAYYSLQKAGLPAPTVLISTFESVSLAA